MKSKNTSSEPGTIENLNAVLGQRFKSNNEIIKDPVFIGFVDSNLKEISRERRHRPNPEPGYYYKMDWYDRMVESKSLKTEFFLNNIENIWNKRSSLSSEVRQVIQYVCNKALQKTLVEYSKQKPTEIVRRKPQARRGKAIA